MSYIGQQLPADVFSGFTTDSFTGDGSATTFTLSKAPFSEDGLIVVINNVIQKPTTNFTVSGTTLTIVGTAVASGDVIYAMHTSGAVPITQASKVDVNGLSDGVILDADADTTISADTDDQIDFKAGGTDIMSLTATTATFNDGVTITTADNTDTLTLISTDTDANYGPNIEMSRPVTGTTNDLLGRIDFSGQDAAGNTHNFFSIEAIIDNATSGSEDGRMLMRTEVNGATKNMFDINGAEFVFNEDQVDYDFRIESNGLSHLFFIDATNNEVQASNVGSFYDTDRVFSVRQSANNGGAIHVSNAATDNTNTGLMAMSLNVDESTSAGFQLMTDYNDNQIFFRGDGNGFFDGAADAGNADFAEYFESTDGSAIAIGKTVVLDSGKVRASTDSDNAADILGVVRHRKTVGVVGNSAWNKWKGKYKVDDYGVPLTENYSVTKWTETFTENVKDFKLTYNGKVTTFNKKKGKSMEHNYRTDEIPSEVTVPSNATVVDVDADGVKLTRKILNDNYDASKEYVSREDRDEWNLIGLIGQVTMTKGQKTGDRWIKMRDISETVEEWLIR